MPEVSVILCTHNPHPGRLARTMDGLRAQTLRCALWELLVVDSASTAPLPQFTLKNSRVLREETSGLTRARIAGYQAASGALLVFVDDDNVLAPHYLEQALALFQRYPEVGVAGGRITPEYDVPPPPWIAECHVILALRDFGDGERSVRWTSSSDPWPDFAPVGAGMVIRRSEFARYAAAVGSDPRRMLLDRTGTALTSGGDCDIVLTVLEGGAAVHYSSSLALLHLIPAARLSREYLGRLAESAMHSWVRVLDLHGRRPWKPVPRWAVPFLCAKYHCTHRAWTSDVAWIRWRSYCGQARGRSELTP